MCLEPTRIFSNCSHAWDGTAVRLNPLEISLMVQILTQFGLRMANIRNDPTKNYLSAMRNPEFLLAKLDSNSFVNLEGLTTSVAK